METEKQKSRDTLREGTCRMLILRLVAEHDIYLDLSDVEVIVLADTLYVLTTDLDKSGLDSLAGDLFARMPHLGLTGVIVTDGTIQYSHGVRTLHYPTGLVERMQSEVQHNEI